MAPHFIGDIDSSCEVSVSHPSGESGNKTLSCLSDGKVALDEDKLEPIAIVGFCFRFPDDAVNSRSFWNMMMEKRCAMTESPKDRISVPGWHHPDSRRRGQYPSRGAHYLKEDISLFDAPFFSLSADEAAALDPQQRHLLEVTYGALENAGIPMEKAVGSQTSVHVGCMNGDYRLMACKDVEMTADYDVVGINMCMNANRISWFFDFHGTSIDIDTACSSSLVAMDLACQCLQNGDTEMGIVSGTNLILSADMMQVFSNVNMLSPDSKCHSFDHRANGYGRGEGTATLVIKRLSSAIRDGDTIRAVIRSTGSNSDGLTPSGIMQPNGSAQAQLIWNTYRKAGLSMEPTRFFEAHGTGTPVGDPIECYALGEAFCGARTNNDPLIVGSVKSNIGHLEGASGVAALIKTILILESGMIPPNTNFEKVNPKIDLDFLRLKLPLEAIPWPTRGLRRASVNSFGFGGSNAHVVLDDAFHFLRDHELVGNHVTTEFPPVLSAANAPPKAPERLISMVPEPTLESPKLLVISSSSKTGVKDVALAYKLYFEGLAFSPGRFLEYMGDLAHTLNTRRSALTYKSFWVASSPSDLCSVNEKTSSVYQTFEKPVLGFVFTGQGSQWAGMGRELFHYSVFRNIIEKCEVALRGFGCPWSLREEILNDSPSSRINEPEVAQSANTALQIALVELLHDVGVQPTAVIGHSSGEIAAAYALGALSINDAMKIAYYRGVCATEVTRIEQRSGAMIAVGLSEADTRAYMDRVWDVHNRRGIYIACINSQKSVTVSGDADQVEILGRLLNADNVFARKLKIPVAYHSSHMKQVAAFYEKCMAGLCKGSAADARPGVMFSSVTGQRVQVAELRSPHYWVANLVSTVKFMDSFLSICTRSGRRTRKKLDGSHRAQLGVNILLEVGPHATLQGPIRDMLDSLPWGRDVSYFPVIRRKENAANSFLSALGHIHCLGSLVSMDRVNRLTGSARQHYHVLTDLPQYSFDHSTSYWRESQLSKRSRLASQGRHDILGKPVMDWNPLEARWRHHIRLSEMPWVEDHIVNGTLIYPAAGMLAMAIEAADQIADPDRRVLGFQLKDVKFQRAIMVPRAADGIETNLLLRTILEGGNIASWMEFRLFSYDNDAWQENCHGHIKIDYGSVDELTEQDQDLKDWLQQDNEIAKACTTEIEHARLYERFHNCGFKFGPQFQTVLGGKFNKDHQATASIKVFQWPASQYPQAHVIHPTTLDGILHLSSAAIVASDMFGKAPTAIPTGIRSLWVAQRGLSGPSIATVHASTWKKTTHSRGHEFDVGATDEQQTRLLVQVRGLQSTVVADSTRDVSKHTNAKTTAYHISRVPDLDMLSTEQLTKYCEQALPQDPEPVDFFKELNFILYKFLDDAVQALSGDITNDHGVQPHIRRYTEWARQQRTKYHTGQLPLSRDEWADYLRNPEYFEAACQRVASTNDLGYAFVHTGRNLLRILRGEQNSLQFLFTGNMMESWYSEVNNRAGCFNTWGLYLKTLAKKNPTMRILELGAGTGGSTWHILNILSVDCNDDNPLYMSYDYTDISSAFFERAAKRFAKFPRISFKNLDINEDSTVQGFQLESYDLIVAANVLHATPDIKATMQNVRKLLKPNGKVMLYEITRPEIIRSSFVAGLMEGWWASVDNSRPWSPALTVTQWDSLLKETGFTGVDIEFPDFISSECQEMAILVASASESTIDDMPGSASKPVPISFSFVIDPTSTRQKAICERAGQQLHLLYPESAIQCCSLKDCASLPALSEVTLVFIQETETPLLSDMTRETFSQIQHLVNQCNSILWVTAGGGRRLKKPEYAIVDGWARTLRNEKASRRFCTLSLDINQEIQSHQVEYIVRVIENALFKQTGPYEPEFVEINRMLHILRAEPTKQLTDDIFAASLPKQSAVSLLSEAGPVQLAFSTPGLLSSLHWADDHDAFQPLQSDEVQIDTQAVGVNFEDVQIVLGKDLQNSLGQECAGVVTQAGELSGFLPGDRVLLFGPGQFKTKARARRSAVCRIPEDISFTHAAGVSATFGTVWHILFDISRLRSSQSVLVHAGAGGIGQAAIQLAQYIGAKVFTTVSTREQKQLLIDEYGIPADHIFYSRDIRFTRGVMKLTKDHGVDVVVNVLGGEILQGSWDCVASYGHLIHIGSLSNDSFSLAQTGRQASLTHFDSSTWMRDRPEIAKGAIETVLNLIAESQLRVQSPYMTEDARSMERIFYSMQDRTAMGKTVIDLTPKVEVPTILKTKVLFKLNPDATYVIAGGLGGLGRTIARWMVDRGACNLVLLGRSGAKTTAAFELIDELSAQGVYVQTPPCDVIDPESVRQVMQKVSQTMPPVKGCVQGSMVLRDSMFSDMTYEDWRMAVECKALGSWNLEMNLPKDLDFFVMLSSASNIIGLTGQSNYAAGNSYMDGLTRYRIAHGQKAVSLDLGPMIDDGILVETAGFLDKVLAYGSLAPVTRAQLYGILNHYCNPSEQILDPDTAQLVFGISGSGDRNTLVETPLFSRLKLDNISSNSVLQGECHNKIDFRNLFQEATSLQEAREIVRRAVIDKMVHSYHLIPEDAEVDAYAPLYTFRVDSLLAVELCNWIGQEFAADIAVMEIMGGASLVMVDLTVVTRSQLTHPRWT
ncbi:hypothetical protein BDV34DRAFT_1922 [Aspergillus parasiticus]|uniref:Carrier domain-containing protein n=1 Tax=Aspergillus parasiticus TaxID=5067 RepID=A0A5N6E5Z9_ASPPA|nr:hypothetical protein BDV34DRAFT_1922 [Aspergillus parasiticus]